MNHCSSKLLSDHCGSLPLKINSADLACLFPWIKEILVYVYFSVSEEEKVRSKIERQQALEAAKQAKKERGRLNSFTLFILLGSLLLCSKQISIVPPPNKCLKFMTFFLGGGC